jgi:hydrogenase maturation protease
LQNEHGSKVLIAGVGNVLRGDDGFGIEVAHRLMQRPDLPSGTKVIETGIGGMSLVQELMTGYDALMLLDACHRGGQPGSLYLLVPELPDLTALDTHQLRDYFSDTHYATPLRALSLVAQIKCLPPVVRVLGCEAQETEDYRIGLSQAVAAAVDEGVTMALRWAGEILGGAERNPSVPRREADGNGSP